MSGVNDELMQIILASGDLNNRYVNIHDGVLCLQKFTRHDYDKDVADLRTMIVQALVLKTRIETVEENKEEEYPIELCSVLKTYISFLPERFGWLLLIVEEMAQQAKKPNWNPITLWKQWRLFNKNVDIVAKNEEYSVNIGKVLNYWVEEYFKRNL